MGLLGLDANKITQSTTQAQTASESGVAFGAATGKQAVGGGSTGNITGNLKIGKGASFKMESPEAIEALRQTSLASQETARQLSVLSHATAIEEIKANQALSTQAIGFANQNANMAMETLQSLGGQMAVLAGGGTGSEIASAGTGAMPTEYSSAIEWGLGAVVMIGLAIGAYYVWFRK